MAKIIVSGGGATSAAHVDYISRSNTSKKDTENRDLFNRIENGLSRRKASSLIENNEDENHQGQFFKFEISLERTNFNRLGETEDERLAGMEKVVSESLEKLWTELGVKDVKWVAGTHLNTNNPHTHIVFNTSAKDLETNEPKDVPKIPRSWFWRERNDNSVLGKLFETPLANHTLATPPQSVRTKKPAEEIFLPVRETDQVRIEKNLNRLSEINGISSNWIEQLTENQSLYVNRQGALTFVRRDVNGFATGYVYENGYQPEDEKGFFYVGNPKTASKFIIADTPKEVLSILELTGHRDLSEVCIVASDKKNTPVAFDKFINEISQTKPARIIWSLGLDREQKQDVGNFEDLKIKLLENREDSAPSLEFYSWQPKPGFGNTWNSQVHARNLPGELNGIIHKVLVADKQTIEPLSETETQNYYAAVAEVFRNVAIKNEDNQFIVYEKTAEGTGLEFGRYAIIPNPDPETNAETPTLFSLLSIGGEKIAESDELQGKELVEEVELIARIQNLFGEKINREFLEAERQISDLENLENDEINEPDLENETPENVQTESAHEVIDDIKKQL